MAGSALILAGATLFCWLAISWQFPSGPDNAACYDATPNHSSNAPVDLEVTPCPYMVDFGAFIPEEPHTLNITSWSRQEAFRGYQLTIFDENNFAVGDFAEDQRTICEGAAATHSDPTDKLYEEVVWTSPSNSSGKVYFVWLSVVKNFETFWVDCDPAILAANDVDISDFETTEDMNDSMNSTEPIDQDTDASDSP